MDFLYYGMANVFQENLDSFLSIAEEFEFKGLMGQGDNTRRKSLVKWEANRTTAEKMAPNKTDS